MTSSKRPIPRSLGLLSRLHMTCHFVLPSTVIWIPKVSCLNVFPFVTAWTNTANETAAYAMRQRFGQKDPSEKPEHIEY